MASRFVLVQSGGSTLTINHPGGPAPIGGARRSVTIEQAPNSQEAWVDGDATELVQQFEMVWTIRTSSGELTHAEIDAIVAAAETASSIKRVVNGVDVSWRALQGIVEDQPVVPGASRKTVVLKITFIPLFPRWTTTQAEDAAAYDAATKRRYC